MGRLGMEVISNKMGGANLCENQMTKDLKREMHEIREKRPRGRGEGGRGDDRFDSMYLGRQEKGVSV